MGEQEKEKTEGKETDIGNELIVLGKCFSCHKSYILKLMLPFELAEPHEDGIRRCKRYLCPECGNRLKEFNWIKEQEFEKSKTKKEQKED